MSQHTSKDNNAVISEGGEYSVSYYGAFKIWRGNELIGEFLAPDANTALRRYHEESTRFAVAAAQAAPLVTIDFS